MKNSWLDRNRHLAFLLLLVTALGGAGMLYLRRPAPEPIEIEPPPQTEAAPSATPAQVRVYVTGAVVNSDVYFLPRGSIVKDAILAAGGVTEEADLEHINQALEVKDQQQIHVPRQGEEAAPQDVSSGGSSAGLVNLNTATVEELTTLPGIGPALAQRIVAYREEAGGFASIEEVTQVSGIGDATLAKIRDSITVD